MARINATRRSPDRRGPRMRSLRTGPAGEAAPHRDAQPEKFVLIWKQAGTVISTIDVPHEGQSKTMEGADARDVRYPDLAEQDFSRSGPRWVRTATQSDKKFDQAILHTDNETPYSSRSSE